MKKDNKKIKMSKRYKKDIILNKNEKKRKENKSKKSKFVFKINFYFLSLNL